MAAAASATAVLLYTVGGVMGGVEYGGVVCGCVVRLAAVIFCWSDGAAPCRAAKRSAVFRILDRCCAFYLMYYCCIAMYGRWVGMGAYSSTTSFFFMK